MAEENQVMKEPQQITTEPHGEAVQVQQVTKEPQRVTTENPKKVEAGKRLAESNRKRREANKQASGNWRPINQYYGIGAVVALGVIGGLGYHIYRTKKGEHPQGEVQQNNPKPHPQPQTYKFEMD